MGVRIREGFDYLSLVAIEYVDDGRLFVLYDCAPEHNGSHMTGACLIEDPDLDSGLVIEALGCELVPIYVEGGQPILF